MKIKLNLKNNFKLVPEGERILTVKNAEFRPVGKPQELRVTFEDSEGGLINTRYDMTNDKSNWIMGIFISTALNLSSDEEEFETKDVEKLIGKKLLCEVVHRDGTKPNENGEVPVFANINKIIKLVDDYTDTDLSPRNVIANESFNVNDLF